MTTDRRVRRTQRLLREALAELIVERGYDGITVQEILDRADVGRSTFYAHFRDKEALFASCFDDLREGLQRELDVLGPDSPPTDPTRPLGVIFQHAGRNRDLYRAMCGRRGDGPIRRHLHDLLLHALRAHIADVGTRLPAELLAEYHAGALAGVLVWWVRQDFPHPPDRMARLCLEVAAPSFAAH